MLTLLCHRVTDDAAATPMHFYRVDVTYNLFGEYTVMRAWGQVGSRGRYANAWFGNLRDAIVVADQSYRRATGRGYRLTEKVFASAA
ncbi:WGR domain-containing protein [Rhodobacteraceae bacterium 2376]|uniref:WGR domain-containing protein n=1 Tax=Rhabdonatronobacter sediminivivens TaxID=2743469 RepID=A0A7Z0I2L5_9RHOB|nr:WGR domain-containing protein [Rhabdonatronobacter sediminivivens]NYS26799.1 WGR domain-containing protein [Rhabdonatronobacter sediminivivens]